MTDSQKRVKTVLERLIRMVEQDPKDAEMFSDDLEFMLSGMAEDDFFGTEKQLDPRGDGREGNYSMSYVQGIDDVGKK